MKKSYGKTLTGAFRISLKKRIVGMILAFAVVVFLCYVILDYMNFVDIKDDFSYSTASTVAKTCVLIINSDRIAEYRDTLQRDTEYYETWNKMIDYRNTNEYIVNLSLVSFKEEGCYYIYDTNLSMDGAFLGDKKDYDSRQMKYKEDLINGKEIGYIRYTNRMDVYVPVLSSYNIPVGYVIAGISTTNFDREQLIYFIITLLVLLALTIITVSIFLNILNRRVIGPINKLSEAAASYKESIDEKTKTSALDRIEIRTGDEIEELSNSLKKMEKDIIISSNNLGIALWNSQHDSMTQLFNKRRFHELIDDFNKLKSIGIIYFDIDNLKKMNDTYGHEQGDELIIKTADFLKKYEESYCQSYRVGGDEFIMVLCNCTKEELEEIVERMNGDPDVFLSDFSKPIQSRIAIGCAYSAGNIDIEEAVKEADKNMYINKQSHKK